MAANAEAVFEVADGLSLKQRLAKAERRNKIRAFLLVLPLLTFIGFSFIAPICFMMVRSFYDPLITEIFPETLAAVENWDPATGELPDDAAFGVLAREIATAYDNRTLGRAATRLNFDNSGMRSLLMKSGRRMTKIVKVGTPSSWRQVVLKQDKRWGNIDNWATLKQTGDSVTASFYLKALDFKYSTTGDVVAVDEGRQLYLLLG
jgi:putative spermidine/putrescine transport system permease protein